MHELPPILFGGIRFICAGILLGITALALGSRFDLDATEWRHLSIVAVGSVVIPNGFTNWAMQTSRPTRRRSSMSPPRCGSR